jgi:hypothetical protein
MRGAAKGLMVSGLTIGAGYALDKTLSDQYGYQSHFDGATRLALDGFAIPAILLSELPARLKFPLAATTFLGTRMLSSARHNDNTHLSGMGSELLHTSNLMRPNIIDGVGITAAALAPLPAKVRVLAIGGAVIAGRAYNILESKLSPGGAR